MGTMLAEDVARGGLDGETGLIAMRLCLLTQSSYTRARSELIYHHDDAAHKELESTCCTSFRGSSQSASRPHVLAWPLTEMERQREGTSSR